MAYYNEDGEVVEGLLPKEEVDKKIKEEVDKVAAEKTAAEDKIKTLEEEVTKAKAAINGAGDGDDDKEKNIVVLRKKLQDTESALEDMKKVNDGRWSSLEGDRISSAITSVAGKDEELAKKIRHHFEKTLAAVEVKTAEDFQKKMASALKLSTDAPAGADPLRVAAGGGSFSAGGHSTEPKVFSDSVKNVGKKMGISEEDYKKYGADPRLQ